MTPPLADVEEATRRRRVFREIAFAALLFAVLAVVMTWPLATDPGHLIPDTGDPYLNAWIIHWDWTSLTHHPFQLFDANIFYPAKLALAFSENLLGIAPFSFPIFASRATALFTYNVVFLIGIGVAGLGAWAFTRAITGSGWGGVLAGIFYAFVPQRFEHLSHIQMQWGGFIPLTFLFLWRFMENKKRHDLVLFVLFFTWNFLTCIYYGVFCSMACMLILLLEVARGDRWKPRELFVRMTIGLAPGILVLLSVLLPYARAARVYGFRRSLGETTFYSAKPTAFLSAGRRSRLYGAATSKFDAPETQLFPGLVVPLLAAVGLVVSSRRKPVPERNSTRRAVPVPLDLSIALLLVLRLSLVLTGGFTLGGIIRMHEPYRLSFLIALLLLLRLAIRIPAVSRFRDLRDFLRRTRLGRVGVLAVGLMLLGVLIALGPRIFFYRELYEVAPFILGSIRSPSRGFVIAQLGLGLAAAIAVAQFPTRARAWLPPILAGLLLFELIPAHLDYQRPPVEPPPSSRWLRSQSFEGGVLELPMKPEDNFEYVYRVTQHNHPILNGFSGFLPPDFLDIQSRFASNPVRSGTMQRIRGLDARLVIFHPGKATADELVSIPAFLKEEKRVGALKAAAYFHDSRDTSLVFEIPSAVPVATSAEANSAERNIDAFLANPGEAATPPYGWFDGPVNGAVIQGGEIKGSGWAASDSGMDRVEISLDGKVVGHATYGFPRPDVVAAKPQVPCKALCGYRFRVVDVPPGKHVLSTRFVGKNGKDVTLPAAEIWISR